MDEEKNVFHQMADEEIVNQDLIAVINLDNDDDFIPKENGAP